MERLVSIKNRGVVRRGEVMLKSVIYFLPMLSLQLLKNMTSPAYAAQIRSQISDTRTWNDASHYGAVLAQPEDHGTVNLCVLAPNGDAVTVTRTINLFGAQE
uniref:Uncharacterized protein n=1 Tax=Timema genevievae TaxID=629358 RepID=A0A7R9PRM3_TIMGE|nr:unnamed protein product [Timema genevievae]